MSAAVSAYLRTVLPELTELPASARHVAEVLGHYANRDGLAWCSVATLAARAGLHPGTVRRARAALVAAGVIAVDVSAGGPPTATNLYRFPVAEVIHTPRTVRGVQAVNPAHSARYPAHSARLPRAQCATKIHEGSIEAPAPTATDASTPAPPPWFVLGITRDEWLTAQREAAS